LGARGYPVAAIRFTPPYASRVSGVPRHARWEGSVRHRRLGATVAGSLAALALVACSSEGSSPSAEERGATIVEACREHGGVSAFDDEAVICRDQSSVEERGARAADACRAHGGVSAFDDDVVICRDQTIHEAEE
jgi:hypothetical protein